MSRYRTERRGALLVVGLVVVHRTTLLRGVVAAALPAALVFGVAYRGLWAWGSLTAGVAG